MKELAVMVLEQVDYAWWEGDDGYVVQKVRQTWFDYFYISKEDSVGSNMFVLRHGLSQCQLMPIPNLWVLVAQDRCTKVR